MSAPVIIGGEADRPECRWLAAPPRNTDVLVASRVRIARWQREHLPGFVFRLPGCHLRAGGKDCVQWGIPAEPGVGIVAAGLCCWSWGRVPATGRRLPLMSASRRGCQRGRRSPPGFLRTSAIFRKNRWYRRASSKCERSRVSVGMELNMTVSLWAVVGCSHHCVPAADVTPEHRLLNRPRAGYSPMMTVPLRGVLTARMLMLAQPPLSCPGQPAAIRWRSSWAATSLLLTKPSTTPCC